MADLRDQLGSSFQDLIALYLWELEAIRVNIGSPFVLTSGKLSPIYVDCRALISSPSFMKLYVAGCMRLLEQNKIAPDIIAGGESAGIPFAAYLADSLGKPMAYVRKELREHGSKSRVEGRIPSGADVLLAEDLITDAGSKLSFVNALRQQGCNCSHTIVVLDREQGGREVLEKSGVTLHALTTLKVALSCASSFGLLDPSDIQIVKKYLATPQG